MYRMLLVALLSLAVPATGLIGKASAQDKDKAVQKDTGDKKDSASKDDGNRVVPLQAVHVHSIDGYLWFAVIFALALLALNAILLIMLRSDLAKPAGIK